MVMFVRPVCSKDGCVIVVVAEIVFQNPFARRNRFLRVMLARVSHRQYARTGHRACASAFVFRQVSVDIAFLTFEKATFNELHCGVDVFFWHVKASVSGRP